jgi:chromosome partitioning protein
VPRNIRLAEAPSHGKAILQYDPKSRGAESYIKLAKEIIERSSGRQSQQGMDQRVPPLAS